MIKFNEKNSAKKEVEAKDQCYPKEIVGTLQKHYQKDLWKFLLHLSKNRPPGIQLAYGSLVVKGLSGSLFEIRFTGTKTAVLQMQHPSRRNGSRLLSQNDKRSRDNRNGKTRKGSSKNSKRL